MAEQLALPSATAVLVTAVVLAATAIYCWRAHGETERGTERDAEQEAEGDGDAAAVAGRGE